jgi:hypothetical protein
MTACQTLEEKLPAYLEGELSVTEKNEFEKHLESCAFCRMALQDLRKTGEALAGLEEKEPPPWFTQKVMARVKAEAEGKKGWLRKLFFPLHIKIPIEVMATLMIAVLAWTLYQAAPPEMTVLPQAPESVQTPTRGDRLKKAERDLPAAASPAPAGNRIDRDTPGQEQDFKDKILSGGIGGIAQKEERIVTSKSAETILPEEKTADRAEKPGEAGPAKSSVKEPETEPAKAKTAQSPAPAPAVKAAPKEMEEMLRDEGGTKRQKLDLAKDQARVMGKAFLTLPPRVFTVRVKDVGQATDAIQALLKQRNAENILEETQAGKKVISAVVGVQEIEGIYMQLKELGEVRPIEGPAPSEGKPMRIKIEIMDIRI